MASLRYSGLSKTEGRHFFDHLSMLTQLRDRWNFLKNIQKLYPNQFAGSHQSKLTLKLEKDNDRKQTVAVNNTKRRADLLFSTKNQPPITETETTLPMHVATDSTHTNTVRGNVHSSISLPLQIPSLLLQSHFATYFA